MDLDRMLEKCKRGQWKVDDLDWTVRPRALGREDEIALVQLFTDMAGIELLAGALFAEQARRARDPRLKAIFESFVVDERRHSECAARLARFYDRHRYKIYRTNENLIRFRPHFVDAIRFLPDDIANTYITCGELILDVALLRSINDFAHDEMSAQAMRLINRDESRHIAVDYHMGEVFTSEVWQREEQERKKLERQGSRRRERAARGARAAWTFSCMLLAAKPFFRDVFFEPMERVDPSGVRITEAFKRMQLLGANRGIKRRPFAQWLMALQAAYESPAGPVLGKVIERLAGVEGRFIKRLITDEEEARAAQMTFSELAEEAMAAKHIGAVA